MSDPHPPRPAESSTDHATHPVKETAAPALTPQPAAAPALPAASAGHWLKDPRLQGRGNAPVRTAMLLQLQQSVGNRAVQRALTGGPGAAGRAVPLQRAPAPEADAPAAARALWNTLVVNPLSAAQAKLDKDTTQAAAAEADVLAALGGLAAVHTPVPGSPLVAQQISAERARLLGLIAELGPFSGNPGFPLESVITFCRRTQQKAQAVVTHLRPPAKEAKAPFNESDIVPSGTTDAVAGTGKSGSGGPEFVLGGTTDTVAGTSSATSYVPIDAGNPAAALFETGVAAKLTAAEALLESVPQAPGAAAAGAPAVLQQAYDLLSATPATVQALQSSQAAVDPRARERLEALHAEVTTLLAMLKSQLGEKQQHGVIKQHLNEAVDGAVAIGAALDPAIIDSKGGGV